MPILEDLEENIYTVFDLVLCMCLLMSYLHEGPLDPLMVSSRCELSEPKRTSRMMTRAVMVVTTWGLHSLDIGVKWLGLGCLGFEAHVLDFFVLACPAKPIFFSRGASAWPRPTSCSKTYKLNTFGGRRWRHSWVMHGPLCISEKIDPTLLFT